VRALHVFTVMLAAEADGSGAPALRLAAMARTYVRFAAEQRPLFDALYSPSTGPHGRRLNRCRQPGPQNHRGTFPVLPASAYRKAWLLRRMSRSHRRGAPGRSG